MNGTRVPSGRSAAASMPRTARSSFNAIAIGQYSFQEPHHSLDPRTGPMTPQRRRCLVEVGDPPGGIGGVDCGGQCIEQPSKPAFALAQRPL